VSSHGDVDVEVRTSRRVSEVAAGEAPAVLAGPGAPGSGELVRTRLRGTRDGEERVCVCILTAVCCDGVRVSVVRGRRACVFNLYMPELAKIICYHPRHVPTLIDRLGGRAHETKAIGSF
jgi:hypothetical protein